MKYATSLVEKLAEAMFAGDVDVLDELAPCRCCCHEHTFAYCEARLWGGCRSGLTLGESEQDSFESWRNHYVKFHGMRPEDF